MRVISGEYRGWELDLRDYDDTWISGQAEGTVLILDPLRVRLSTPEEVEWITQRDRMARSRTFWERFELRGWRFVVREDWRGDDRGRLVRPDDAAAGQRGRDAVGNAATDVIERDSPAGEMLVAVAAAAVIYDTDTEQSAWRSPFHMLGYRYLGGRCLVPSLGWGSTERTALLVLRTAGLVWLNGCRWMVTERGWMAQRHWASLSSREGSANIA